METTTKVLSGSTSQVINGIIRDYPLFEEIENLEAKKIIVKAFDETTGLRAEFLKWAFAVNVAKVQGEKGGLAYELPEGVSLRPEAMIMLEENIVEWGLRVDGSTPTRAFLVLTNRVNHYRERVADYLETLKTQLLFAQQSQL